MDKPSLKVIIIDAWQAVAHYVARGHAAEFSGQSKETLVFRSLRNEIERLTPSVRIKGPDDQERINNWSIDLVCKNGAETTIAIQGKYKIDSDGAVPDNRKAAFLIYTNWKRTWIAGGIRKEFFSGLPINKTILGAQRAIHMTSALTTAEFTKQVCHLTRSALETLCRYRSFSRGAMCLSGRQ